MNKLNFDVLIIGSGLAGLSSALKLADTKKIAVISKCKLVDSSSHWAQGGIASSISENDSTKSHIEDTKIAGAGLCNYDVTKFVTENSKEALNWLTKTGVKFTKEKDGQGLHLTQEGGHSHKRIAHVKDTTGKAIQDCLIDLVLSHPNITTFENHIAVDFTCSACRKNCIRRRNCIYAVYLIIKYVCT